MEKMKNIFLTGITGFIGGTIAVKLKERNYNVVGLARKEEDVKAIQQLGFECVKGSLQDISVLKNAIEKCDAVIHTADSDNMYIADNFIDILKHSGKTFIYTSGSNIIANWDNPATAEFVYTEDFPIETTSPNGHRVAINNKILRAAIQNIRAIVIVPSMVYGDGLLLKKESAQLPLLIKTAKSKKAGVYTGNKEHGWSNIHVEDLAELYISALEKAKSGSYFFAENGFSTFYTLAKTIHHSLGYLGEPISLNTIEAIGIWGKMMATVALGSDCRMNSDKARTMLHWKPTHPYITAYIKTTLHHEI
ncbi:MAG: epimerase [Pseudopedobacter saltans]|uniref:Epimerase n=1 Tax=Pseudopedobacter saltans TaxID=151895 RepID=A0A2W5GGE3_9SPHI|nr:MAG: epimerase [Pseudopedobacter saltans]